MDEHKIPPWAQGPFELIRHANEHSSAKGDVDRRIALIGFDNAIEVCIDLFLSLHPKIRDGFELSKIETEKAKQNYHTKIELFFEYIQTNKIQINLKLEHVLWYHQLRNNLYHSGHGMVPEKHILIGAKAAACEVFFTLFNRTH